MEENEEKEVEFMMDYIWRTLISLYTRFNIKEKIRLRNIDDYIEIDPSISDIFKIAIYFDKLVSSIKEILNRFQFLYEEKITLNKSAIKGNIETKLLGKHLPTYVPARQKFMKYNIPANLLVVITLLEIRSKSLRIIKKLHRDDSILYKSFRKYIINRFNQIISICNYMLSDPFLKPILREVSLYRHHRIDELEKRVQLDYIKKPRLFRAYRGLLIYRRLLKKKLVVAWREIDKINQMLVLNLKPEKIYELFGFTIFLNTLFKTIKNTDKVSVVINKSGKEIEIHNDLKIYIAYNAIPDDIQSKFDKAIVYGLVNGKIKASNIKGLPDTFLLIEKNEYRKLLVIDYKYSRSLSYLVNSRYKVYSYLNEYNADVAIVISPTPSISSNKFNDEEEYEHSSFYREIIKHQGAMIYIDNNGKVLAILYLNPDKESVKKAEKALTKILRLVFP